MAGVATAYSTDALTSPGGVDSSQWEFSVPIGHDVSYFPCPESRNTDGGRGGAKKIFYSRSFPFLGYPAFLEATELPRFEFGPCEIDSKTQLQRLPEFIGFPQCPGPRFPLPSLQPRPTRPEPKPTGK